jgi:hypothetical protein
MNALEMAGTVGFVGAGIAAVYCWWIGIMNMFRTVANRKLGVPLFPHWWESPFNILFRPWQLTDRGLDARRKCFLGMLGFVAFCVLSVIVGIVVKVEDGLMVFENELHDHPQRIRYEREACSSATIAEKN